MNFDFDFRRDTFNFDEKMYRDGSIEVTPSVLVLDKYYLPFQGAKEIPIQDIDRVWRDFDSHIPPTRWLGSLRTTRRTSRPFARRVRGSTHRPLSTNNNLIINLKGGKSFRVAVRAEDPNEAYIAVRAAMNTFYPSVDIHL